MIIVRHSKYLKAFNKRIKPFLPLVEQFKERWMIFEQNSKDPLLKDHALKGNLKGFRAFSITGNIRLMYKKEKDNIILYDIGTHNQVYK